MNPKFTNIHICSKLTICIIVFISILIASCGSMQSVRTGSYKFFIKEKKSKVPETPSQIIPEGETQQNQVKQNITSNVTKNYPKTIAGEIQDAKDIEKREENAFFELRMEKMEEEIRLLRNEISNLTRIIAEKYDNSSISGTNTKNNVQQKKENSHTSKKSKGTPKPNNTLTTKTPNEHKQSPPQAETQTAFENNVKIEEVIQLIKDRKYDEAIKRIDQYISEANDLRTIGILNYWKGEALYQKREYGKAIEYFQKVLSMQQSTKKTEAQIMIAECYTKLGKLREAKREYQKFIEEYPFSEYAPRAKRMIQQL